MLFLLHITNNIYQKKKKINEVVYIFVIWWSFGESESWFFADSTSVSCFESDETILSPSSTPTVLESPWFCVNTNQENVVIDFSAFTSIENARSVGLPINCIDCHCERTVIERALNGVASVEFHVLVDRLILSSFFLTCIFNTFVGVWCLSGQSLISNICQSAISASTLASEGGVICRAINDLLFRQSYVLIL